MRYIGLDVHRTFAEVAMIEEGRSRRAGRVATTAEALRRFATTLTAEDHVVLEATCNTEAIARVLQQHAGRVVISNPLRTRAIADAKIKTDKIDATVLAQLLASGFLPEVWLPDEETARRRRQVARRAQVVRQRGVRLAGRCPESVAVQRTGSTVFVSTSFFSFQGRPIFHFLCKAASAPLLAHQAQAIGPAQQGFRYCRA